MSSGSEPQCSGGVETRQRVIALEKSEARQWEILDRVENRLPLWGTIVISILTAAAGAAITYAAAVAHP